MDAIVYDKVGKEAEKVRDALYGIYPQETITDAAIASFDDGADGIPVKALTVGIEPVQDLHGYSNPWPAGGNYNKLPITLVSGTYNGVTATVYSDNRGIVLSGQKTGSAGPTIYYGDLPAGIDAGGQYIFSWGNVVESMQLIVYNASNVQTVLVNSGGSISRTINIPSDATKLEIRVWLESTSVYNVTIYPMIRDSSVDETAYVPYSNECPISGWTSAEIEQTGKNLIPEVYNYYKHNPTFADAIFLRAGTYYLSYNVTGAANWRPTIRYYYPDGSINSDTEYKPNIDGSINNAYYDANLKAWQYAANTTTRSHTIIIPKDTWFVFFLSSGAVTSDTTISNAMMSFENNSTYAPYTGNQISVTFPDEAGTVYGGTLALNPDRTGILVVDMAVADLSQTRLRYDSSGMWYAAIISGSKMTGNVLCENYRYQYNNSDIANARALGASFMTNGIMYFCNMDKDPDNHPAGKMVYTLSNPVTFQLTAEQVSGILSTLYGTNNIWADTGNIEKLTYRADLGRYIDSHITTAVANALNA